MKPADSRLAGFRMLLASGNVKLIKPHDGSAAYTIGALAYRASCEDEFRQLLLAGELQMVTRSVEGDIYALQPADPAVDHAKRTGG